MLNRPKRVASLLLRRWYLLSILLVVLLPGCGGGSTSLNTTYVAPPAPVPGATAVDPFYINTSNYFSTQDGGVSPYTQFADRHYPIPFAYERNTEEAPAFLLPEQSELSVQVWAEADPRISMISGVPVGQQRVKVILVPSITYNNNPRIIGLTKLVSSGSNPKFEVYVAVRDPITNVVRTNADMSKTLTHEFGHVFGLGHSPDQRDLMYYQDNTMQGATTDTFLTFGDAITVWTTLNNRHINWVETRPTVSYPAGGVVQTMERTRGATTVIEDGGVVIDVYTPEE